MTNNNNNQVAVFKSAGLPAVSDLAKALKTVDAGNITGGVILKMDKTGTWVFGADQTETEEDALWAVNPFSFVHGYIAWGGGQPLAEKMAAITEPLPDAGAAPPCSDKDYKGWQLQLGFSLKCISGEDAGTEMRFASTSVGGKRAVQELGIAIAEQVEKDQTHPVPIVKLETESYKHATYGKVYTPKLAIQHFVTMDGEQAKAAAPAAAEPAPAEAGRRRRRRRAG